MGGMNKAHTTALAVLSFQLPVGASEIQLTPPGPTFRSADGSGRPLDVATWRIDEQVASRLIARMKAKANDIPVDYEHQTLLTDQNGQPAPAAGWFKELEWRPGQGLFAVGVRWTPRAAEMLKAGEYRYISPVFAYNKKTGEVEDVRMAALTNTPGLDGMASVALSAALANFDFQSTKESEMDLKQILAALGLPDTTDEATALTTLAALKAQQESEVRDQGSKAVDPEKFVSIAVLRELQAEYVALSGRINQGEAEKLIDAAADTGKPVTPELRAHLLALGKTNLAAMKSILEATPATAALRGMQSDAVKSGATAPAGSFTTEELAAMKATGISAEDFLKAKGV